MSQEASELVYLDVADVIGLYAEIFGCSDADAANQLRSQPGLEGALARPRSHAAYGDADLATQAAVLAHGIAEGQRFVDGNKRTALSGGLAAATDSAGRIFVMGGNNGINTVQRYSPGTNSWVTIAPMPTGRYLLMAATGLDGFIYAIGGGNGSPINLQTVEAYDPSLG